MKSSHAETTSTRTELNNSTTETKQWWDLSTDFDAFSSVLREKGLEILLENYRFVELSQQLRSENSLIKGE